MRWLAPLFLILAIISFMIEASSRDAASPTPAPTASESGATSGPGDVTLTAPAVEADRSQTLACREINEAEDLESSIFLRSLTGVWRDDLSPASVESNNLSLSQEASAFDGLSLSYQPAENFTARVVLAQDLSVSHVVRKSGVARAVRVSRTDSEGFRTVQILANPCLALDLKIIYVSDGPEILISREANGALRKYVH